MFAASLRSWVQRTFAISKQARRSGRGRPRFRPRLDALEERLAPAVVVWDGGPLGTGTSWNDPANWVGERLPEAGDDAEIGAAFNGITITSTADVSINSVTSAAALRIMAGTFTVAATATITNMLTLADGTFTGAGDLTVSGLEWSGGTMAGTGRTVLAAGVTGEIAGIGRKTLDRTIDNAGTLSYPGDNLFFGKDAAGVINNQAGGTLNAVGSFYYNAGSGHAVNNQGTFNRSGPGITIFDFRVAFNNQGGTVNVQEGTLRLGIAGTSTGGEFNATAAGAILDLSGHTLRGRFTGSGAGTVQIDGPTTIGAGGATFDFSPGLLQWTRGALIGDALTNVGSLSLSVPNTKELRLTLNNAGTINDNGGGFSFGFAGGPSVLNNQAGGTYNTQGNVAFVVGTSVNPAFNNAGTFTHSGAGSAMFGTAAAFNIQGGTINVLAGAVELRGGGSASGPFTLAAGTVRITAGTYNLQAGANSTGAGTLEVGPLATLYVAGNVSVDRLTLAGTLSGYELTVNPGGTLTWVDGIMARGDRVVIATGATAVIMPSVNRKILDRTLDNAGTINYLGGDLFFGRQSVGVINNQAGGTFNVQGAGSFLVNELPPHGFDHAFNNLGTFNYDSPGGTSFGGSVPFNNQGGTINVLQGTFGLGPGVSTDGTFNVMTTSAVLRLGQPTLRGNFTGTGAGTILLDGGIALIGFGGATFNFPPGLFKWTGGILSGTVLTNLGSLTLATDTEKTLTVNLNNAGTIVYNGSGLVFGSGSSVDVTINNQAGGTVIAVGSFTRSRAFGHTFNNFGTFNRSGPGDTIFDDVTFNNLGGRVNVQTGTLSLRGSGGSASGPFDMASVDARLEISGSPYQVEAGTAFTGPGTLRIFQVSVNAAVSVSNLELFGYLTGAGAVTVTGNFVWTGGGTMSGTGSTTLAVGGHGLLDGFGVKTLDRRTLTLAAYTAWIQQHDLNLANGAQINITGDGVFDISNAQTIRGSGSIRNSGIVSKRDNTAATTVATGVAFSNEGGSVLLYAGALILVDGYTQTDGQTYLSPNTTLAAAGGVNIQGGVLSGFGTIDANVINSGRIEVADSVQTGTLIITGNYTQTTGGSLNIKIGAQGFDALLVGGTATLAGTMNVVRIDNFVPELNDGFRVFDAIGGLTGMFDFINGLGISPTRAFDPRYDQNGLELVVVEV
jgi:hypothetical protein